MHDTTQTSVAMHTLRAVAYPGPSIELRPTLDCPYDTDDPARPCRPPVDLYPRDPQICGPSEAIRDLGIDGTTLTSAHEPVALPAAVSVSINRDEECWELTIEPTLPHDNSRPTSEADR